MTPTERNEYMLKMDPLRPTKMLPHETDDADICFYLHEQGHVKDGGQVYNYPGPLSENEMEKNR